jgi:RNA polymerase sigma factor (sigma-70 family)
MQAMDEMALLREYAANNSETAFAELVSRRVNFVYSSALRQVRDPLMAGEIAQVVFIILAQKAGRISEKTILTGWFFRTTRFAALAQIRADAKRRRRELEVQMQSEFQSPAADEIWNQMSPLLDEALATLCEKDRQAVLLRFFENKSLAEVGNVLGTGEDTARKRVARALEKLHRHFKKRGVSSTTAIIAGTISANSIQAAPVALTKSVAAVAMTKGAAASASTLTLIKGALKIMAWTKVKMAVVAGVGVLLVAGTATVTVKEIEDQTGYRWQVQNPSSQILAKAPPLLKILPTKFNDPPSSTFGIGTGGNDEKRLGSGCPPKRLFTMPIISGVRHGQFC